MLDNVNTRCAQRIHAATFAKDIRSLGLMPVETASRSSELARELAAVTAAFGKRVMLIHAHEPDDFGVRGATAADFVKSAVLGNDGVMSVNVARASDAHRVLNDSRQLRLLLEDLSGMVDAVIIDLPAHDAVSPAIYAPIAASALEAVFMITMPCMTTGAKLEEALSWARESGAGIAAIIVNDRLNPTLAEEIVREAARLKRVLPFLPGFIARKVAVFPALNRHH